MKTTKRALSVLLALALGLALFAPMAAGYSPPIFTKRMPMVTTAKAGKTITLTAEAKLPEDVDAELQYYWSTKDWNASRDAYWNVISGATEPTLTLCFSLEVNDDGIPNLYREYRLEASYDEVCPEGTVIVADYDYTAVIYFLSLSECYEALLISMERGSLPEFITKMVACSIALPAYLGSTIFSGLIWLVGSVFDLLPLERLTQPT